MGSREACRLMKQIVEESETEKKYEGKEEER